MEKSLLNELDNSKNFDCTITIYSLDSEIGFLISIDEPGVYLSSGGQGGYSPKTSPGKFIGAIPPLGLRRKKIFLRKIFIFFCVKSCFVPECNVKMQ